MKFHADIHARQVREAFQKAPATMRREIRPFLLRGAFVIANEMRLRAPKAFSTLTKSIKPDKSGDLEYTIGPHVGYAAYVEFGRKAGGLPPVQAILDWVKVKRLSPRHPGYSQRDLAWAIARKIQLLGIPARPFAIPAAIFAEDRATGLIEQGIAAGLKASGLEGNG